MTRPRRAHTIRPELDSLSIYEYPTHLREAIDALPSTPGVYTFHGAEGDLPLYIGKSVNLRNRVLSHLRTVDEARMLRQTQRISHICTTGEIGALLLEASMIKQQHPLFNQKLRRTKQLCSLRMFANKPEVVYSKEVNFASTPGLYGLYASRHSALEHLRNIADEQRLCLSLLGLEKIKPGQACFRAMINRCGGACRGDEAQDEHLQRLLAALEDIKISCWPYPSAIGLIERLGAEVQIHVIAHWCYLGTVSEISQAQTLDRQAPGFDADGYKILCKPILSGSAEIVLLD